MSEKYIVLSFLGVKETVLFHLGVYHQNKDVINMLIVHWEKTKTTVRPPPALPINSNARTTNAYLRCGYVTRTTTVRTIRTRSKIATVEHAVRNISDVTRAGAYHTLGCATEIQIVRRTKTNRKRAVIQIIIPVNRVISSAKITNASREDGAAITRGTVGMDQMKKVSVRIQFS